MQCSIVVDDISPTVIIPLSPKVLRFNHVNTDEHVVHPYKIFSNFDESLNSPLDIRLITSKRKPSTPNLIQ